MYAKRLCKASAAVTGLMIVMALSAGPVRAARSDVDVDIRGGVYTKTDAPAVGGGLLMGLGSASGWFFNPNIELAFKNNNTATALSGDIHYDFPVAGSLSPYVGAGPSIMFGNNNNDFGVNILGGIAGKRGEVRPFGQLKAVLGGNDEVALMGGVRF